MLLYSNFYCLLSFYLSEPLKGFEPLASSLPRKCSTPELQRLVLIAQHLKLTWAERETRLEPATYSLEGCRSTNWATPAILTQSLLCCANCRGGKWWIRTTEAEATDLQSVPFSHSGNFPITIWSHLSGSNQRPTDYKSVALPAELKWRVKELKIYSWSNWFSAKRTAKKDKKIDISKRLPKNIHKN